MSKKNWKFFLREPNGSVKVCLHFTKEDGDMIEEAAGDMNPVYWARSTILGRAQEKTERMRARRQRQLQGDAATTKGNVHMRLMIVDDDGNAIEVVDLLEDYDLDRPVARAELIGEIKRVVANAARRREGGQ